MTIACATITGIVLQVGGAGYLVFQSWRSSRNLARFPIQITYDALGPTIDALTREVRSQVAQQLIGFAFVLAGSALQLYAVAAG